VDPPPDPEDDQESPILAANRQRAEQAQRKTATISGSKTKVIGPTAAAGPRAVVRPPTRTNIAPAPLKRPVTASAASTAMVGEPPVANDANGTTASTVLNRTKPDATRSIAEASAATVTPKAVLTRSTSTTRLVGKALDLEVQKLLEGVEMDGWSDVDDF